MRKLFTIDLKDYNLNGEKFYRPSVRGIIFDGDGNIAMIYSRKYHFYKFPGGGIEGRETHLEALAREIKEETGMVLIPDSAKEFGEVLKIQNGNDPSKDIIHIQQNFYYICKVDDKIGNQDLDVEEKAMDFILEFVPIEKAIAANSAFESDDRFKKQMAEREKRVLELLKETQISN